MYRKKRTINSTILSYFYHKLNRNLTKCYTIRNKTAKINKKGQYNTDSNSKFTLSVTVQYTS